VVAYIPPSSVDMPTANLFYAVVLAVLRSRAMEDDAL